MFHIQRNTIHRVLYSACAVLDVVIQNHKDEIIAIKPEWYRVKVEAAYRDGDGAQWSGKYFYFFSDSDNREWPENLKNELTVLISVKEATKFKLS